MCSSILVVRNGDSGFVRSRTSQRNDITGQKRLILLSKTHQSMMTEEDSVHYQYLRTYGYESSFESTTQIHETVDDMIYINT